MIERQLPFLCKLIWVKIRGFPVKKGFFGNFLWNKKTPRPLHKANEQGIKKGRISIQNFLFCWYYYYGQKERGYTGKINFLWSFQIFPYCKTVLAKRNSLQNVRTCYILIGNFPVSRRLQPGGGNGWLEKEWSGYYDITGELEKPRIRRRTRR